MAHEVAVMTPEKVMVAYRVARLGSRIGAHLLDIIIILFGIYAITSASAPIANSPVVGPIVAVVLTFFPFIYFILLEGLWNGQTVGKKAAGIRVRMADGTPITFAAAAFRNLLRPADMLPGPYLVGLVMMFLNPRGQRVGDLAAGTMVTHERLPTFLPMPAPHHFGVHPFEQHIGELRRMTRGEYFAIKRLCDRFPQFEMDQQQRLMQEVWEPFKTKHGIETVPNVHDIYLMEAVVMHYSRRHQLL